MSSYGDYFWCAEMNTLLDSVRAAGRQVSALARGGGSDEIDLIGLDPRLDRATAWVDRHSRVFGAPLFGESCKNAVAEGRSVLDGLNDILREFSVTPVTQDIAPVVGEGGSPTDVLSSMKTLVVAAAVIAGVVLLFPVVSEVLVARKAARRVAGYRRRRR